MASLAVTAAELDHLLGSCAFTRRARFRVSGLGDGWCELLVPFSEEDERPGGIVSGQVYMHAADVAFWGAIKTRLGLEDGSVTSNMTTAFLAPARREDVRCRAEVLKLGGRLVHGVAACRSARDERLLTHHTLTYARAPQAR
jgi:acyl-coenzyme A thioesterase PaaI-like protein